MTNIKIIVSDAHAVAQVCGELTEGAVGIPVSFVFSPAWADLTKVAHFAAGGIDVSTTVTSDLVVPWECLRAGQMLLIGVEGWGAGGSVMIPTCWAETRRVNASAGSPAPAPTPDLALQTLMVAEAADRKASEVLERADSGEFIGPKGDKGDKGDPGKIDDASLAKAVSEYLEEHPVEAPVKSVNGKTGDVQLSADDVGALPADTPIPPAYDDSGLRQLIAGKQDTISDLATIRAGAAAGATALQSETDPTVPTWAKQPNKPSYTAAEVGAATPAYVNAAVSAAIAVVDGILDEILEGM